MSRQTCHCPFGGANGYLHTKRDWSARPPSIRTATPLPGLPQSLTDMQVGKITPPDIQTALNRLTERQLSRKTVLHTLPLRMCLAAAVESGLIRRNTGQRDIAPSPAPTHERKAKSLDPTDESALVPCSLLRKKRGIHRGRQPSRERCVAFNFAYRLETKRVHQTDVGRHQRSHGTCQRHQDSVLHTDYTSSMPKDAIDMLDRRRTLHRVYVFAGPTGKPVCGSSLLRWMETHGLHRYTIYGTPYATRARQAGVDVEVLQRLLGHSRVETTLGIYRHVSDAEIESAAAKSEPTATYLQQIDTIRAHPRENPLSLEPRRVSFWSE